MPGANWEVEKVAMPLMMLDVPRGVAPFKNWIEPVAEAGVTEAVKMTVWPALAGFRLEARVRVDAALTVTICGVEVDGL